MPKPKPTTSRTLWGKRFYLAAVVNSAVAARERARYFRALGYAVSWTNTDKKDEWSYYVYTRPKLKSEHK